MVKKAAKKGVQSRPAAKAESGAPRAEPKSGKVAGSNPVPGGAIPMFNRDESWLRFNGRVLEEAQDASNPVLERVKFLAITASNLDEFVEIRVAGMMQRIEDGIHERSGNADAANDSGLTAEAQLERVSGLIANFVGEQYKCWNEQLLPALAEGKVRVLSWKKLSPEARKYAEDFYEREVDPLLTPVTIDPSHPFPRVLNKALCIALLLRHKRHHGKTAEGKRHKSSKVLGVVTVAAEPAASGVPAGTEGACKEGQNGFHLSA